MDDRLPTVERDASAVQSLPLLIHVGYPKAASTWLQNIVFQDEDAGFYAPWGLASGPATDQFVLANAFSFSADAARKVFEEGLKTAAERNLVPVLSQETLVGSQIRGRYWGKEAADRMHSVFPDARILIILREQKSMILSSYREHIKKGGLNKIERFIGVENRKPGFGPMCRLDFLEYDILISYYQNQFGSENVLVLPFELLKKNRLDFLQKIGFFVGIENLKDFPQKPQNVGFHGVTMKFRRQLNYWFQADDFGGKSIPFNWRVVQKLSWIFDRVVPESVHEQAERELKDFIAQSVAGKFGASNRKTSELIGIDLADFGYDC
ncbi:MAG: hypothetical protein SWY16_02840 [Cyanobacteriota bacterium]|nr:hypothetical protein [Cyanobacteriota bacterium]